MLLKKENSVVLTIDPKEVNKKYLIKIGSEFEPYTGKNMKLFIDSIYRRENSKQSIMKSELAKELAKELGYEDCKRATINFDLDYYWEDSDDGFEEHDILRTQIKNITLTVIPKDV